MLFKRTRSAATLLFPLLLLAALSACSNSGNDSNPVDPDPTPTPSSDATLSNLTVSEGSLDPAFSSVQTNYAVTVGNDVASVTVSATTTDDAASVGINGEAPSTGSGSASLDLPVGDTSVSVDVTAEDGSTETYSIVITREASSDSTLSDLSLSAANLNEPFDSATIQYTADVSSETDSTTVTATTSDSAAAITVNGTATASGSPSGDITLDEGDNSIVIEVTGEDGSTTTYTVTVTRAAAPVTTALQVTVLDDAGALVLGASVNVNGLPLAVTAADGRATVDVDPGTTVTIGVSRSGHVPQTRQYDIPPAAAEAVVIMAISRLAEPVTMPAAENGGTAAGSAGASVELPAGALVDSTGQPVTGSVDVFLTPIDVMDERQLRSFPGDFAGTDASGAEVYIASLGMVDFEFAQDGEPLELGTGQTAQIRIPIYTQERSDGIAWAAGDTVPLWSLDPATGLWLEEALGTIIADAASPTGLVLEGTVSHFSPWNADVPLSRRQPLTTLQVNVSCGSIGSPCEGDSIVPEISLRVSNSSPRSPRFSRSFILSVSSTTEMRVPANVNLDLEARGGFNAFAADVTPTQVNLSLGGERSVDVLVRPLHEAGGEFTPGLRLRGAMETVGETHSYFFDGQADEVFSMTAYAAEGLFATIGLTGELGGRVTLFDPAGNELATDVFDAFQTADLNTLLSEAGRYEVRFIAEGKVPGWYVATTGVNPVVTAEAYIKSDIPLTSWFGRIIDQDGDTFVTTPGNSENIVFVYERTSGNTWQLVAEITPPTGSSSGGIFGHSVALDGDTLVIGDWGESSGRSGASCNFNSAGESEGAAFVYRRGTGGAWTFDDCLKPFNGNNSDRFGDTVAVSGNTVAVGASGERGSIAGINASDGTDNSLIGAGAAYVFVRDPDTGNWSQQAYIKPSDLPSSPDNLTGGEFGGFGLDLDGNTLLAGADRSPIGDGGVYVYERSGDTWTEAEKFSPLGSDSDEFGSVLDIRGDRFVVGAPEEDGGGTSPGDGGAIESGAVFVYDRGTAGNWLQTAYLKKAGTITVDGQDFDLAIRAGDEFGSAVALGVDELLIGIPREDSGDPSDPRNTDVRDTGAVIRFVRDGIDWVPDRYLKAFNLDQDDRFGTAVGLSNGIFVIGAFQEDGDVGDPTSNARPDSGAIYAIPR